MKILKILLSLFILFFIIIGLILFSLSKTIPANQFKSKIIHLVQQQYGYHLSIQGDLSWMFYPQISLHIEELSLAKSASTIPFIYLRNVKITPDFILWWQQGRLQTVQINAQSLITFNLTLTNVTAKLTWQNHNINLTPTTADLYGGKALILLTGNSLREAPSWTLEAKFSNVQLKPLLLDLQSTVNKTFYLSGKTDAGLQLKTKGKEKLIILKNLSGKMDFVMREGTLSGIDINYLVQSANAMVNKQPIPAWRALNETLINQMSGQINIDAGIVRANHLLLNSPQFAAKMDGFNNLLTGELDLNLEVTPVQTNTPWLIPIKITGTWTTPKVELNMLKLNTIILSDELEQVKKRVRKELKALPKKVEKLLEKLN